MGLMRTVSGIRPSSAQSDSVRLYWMTARRPRSQDQVLPSCSTITCGTMI